MEYSWLQSLVRTAATSKTASSRPRSQRRTFTVSPRLLSKGITCIFFVAFLALLLNSLHCIFAFSCAVANQQRFSMTRQLYVQQTIGIIASTMIQ